jgi:AcrR family transcriptional regulator
MDTREYIIDKAFDLFLERSYEAVSISDISSAIGLTKGALYHHFASKEELFKAVVNKHLCLTTVDFDYENGSLLEYNKKCISHAENTLKKIIIDDSDFVPLNYVSLITDSFRHYKGFADDKITMMNDETKKIEGLLHKAIQRGEIRSDINIEALALIYISNMLGLAGPFIEKKPISKMIERLQLQYDGLYALLKK